MPDIRVLLLDDRPFVQMGLQSMLSGYPDIEVVGAVAGIAQAVALGRETRPNLVLLNSQHSDLDSAQAISTLRGMLSPPPRVLVLTNSVDDDAHRAVRAGASGLLLEQSSQRALLSAVRTVAAGYLLLAPAVPAPSTALVAEGQSSGRMINRLELLTQREFDVFELIACGWSNADISETLSLSQNTVKSHVRSLLVKLGLRNRVEATIYAYELALTRSAPELDGQ